MKILPRKEFVQRVYESGISKGMTEGEAMEVAASLEAICLVPEMDILVTKGATSTTRIHEVGHKTLGYSSKYSDIETGEHTIGDDILDEILAEKYAYEAKGKKLTHRLAIPAINSLLRRYNWPPEAAVFWSLYVLKKELGVSASKSERRELVRHAGGFPRRPRR